MIQLRLILLIALCGCGGKQATEPAADRAPAPRPLRCDASDPDECDVEGMKFENAVGRPRSKNEAARHYAAACEAGFGPGCTHLAAMYFERDALDEAHQLYVKACDAGDPEGCANLGFMESRAGNAERSRELYTSACADGSMAACENLADVQQAGRGVEVDHGRAQALFQKSCLGGQPSACIRRAWSLAQGCEGGECASTAADEGEAAALTKAACEESANPVVCTGYAVHLESGRLLGKDTDKARELYTAACEAGQPWACERLGNALARGLGGDRDLTAAAAAYERACAADFATGCSALGAMLLAGEGVERDEKAGAKLVRRACELHEARACNTLRLLGL